MNRGGFLAHPVHLPRTNLTIDQIIPLARGGQNDISNLQTLCRPYNQQKKHHLDPRFRRYFSS
jgi:5-methylcytosine-specific restriction endonuclease McrA